MRDETIMIRKVVKAIKKPRLLLFYILGKEVFKIIPDSLYLKVKYRLMIGGKLNLKNPRTYNEKLQWLKLYDRNPSYTKLVDKYEVRKYIEKKIGQEYLIPLLGVYSTFDEINFDTLPDKFVLKCTHDSGGVIICKDKSQLNIDIIRRKINKCLKSNFYVLHREWPYKDIKPQIICEKYMEDTSSGELMDYKLMCFNGEVKCTFVCSNRKSSKGLNIDIFDAEWNLMPFQRQLHPNSGIRLNRPKNYKKMVEFAEKLSKDIPFLRVDFYEVNECLYFGELTFFPGSGFERFMPESYDELLGSWLKLPEKQA